MEKIEPGKYVELGYDLYKVNPDGTETLVHQTDSQDPEKIVFGVTPGLVEPLGKAIEGMSVGDEFDVVAKPEEAFGTRSDEYIVELEKEVFEVDGKFDSEMVKPGEVLPMMTADGFRVSGVVLEVTPTMVRMDFNHPFADCTVRFRGKVLAVREATPEELHPAGGCGCGCNHDHCGDEGNCGDGCCGGGHCN